MVAVAFDESGQYLASAGRDQDAADLEFKAFVASSFRSVDLGGVFNSGIAYSGDGMFIAVTDSVVGRVSVLDSISGQTLLTRFLDRFRDLRLPVTFRSFRFLTLMELFDLWTCGIIQSSKS